MADILDQTYGLNLRRTEISFEVAAAILVYYEYCITFSEEIRCIWKRSFSGVTVLFLINRYAYLLDCAVSLVQVLSWESYSEETAHKICDIVVQIDSGARVCLYFVVVVLSSLRVYAIWSRNRTAAVVILSLGLMNPCLIAFESSRLDIEPAHFPSTGCLIRDHLTGVFYICEMCFTLVTELAVLVLTWMKTARARNELSQARADTPLMTLLLRDGTCYYIAATLAAVVPIGLGVSSPLTDPIVSICTSRLLLSLRQAYLSDAVETLDVTQTHTSVGFATRIVGNLGAPINLASRGFHMEGDWDDFAEDAEHISNDPLVTTLVLDSLAVAENARIQVE